MMKTLKLKNYLLLSIVILSQAHMIFSDTKQRVDWYLLIEHTRRLDYAVMYACKHLIYVIYAYCLLFPKGIKHEIKVFVFILAIADILHYFTTSHIGFAFIKLLGVFGIFLLYKKIKNDENR